jgi:hypothetical protein
MQIVYRATSLISAQRARDLLAAAGIAAHIADPDQTLGGNRSLIHVLVDNRMLDRARRTIQGWSAAN